MRDLMRICLNEEIIAITDDVLEAAILTKMMDYSSKCNDGWFPKCADDIKKDLRLRESKDTIYRRIERLISSGYLKRRKPRRSIEHTYEYLIDFDNISLTMYQNGFLLQGKRIGMDSIRQMHFANMYSHVDNDSVKNTEAHAFSQVAITDSQPANIEYRAEPADVSKSQLTSSFFGNKNSRDYNDAYEKEAFLHRILMKIKELVVEPPVRSMLDKVIPVAIEENKLVLYTPNLQDKIVFDKVIKRKIEKSLKDTDIDEVEFISTRRD